MANKYLENYLICVGSKEICSYRNKTVTSWRFGKVSADYDLRDWPKNIDSDTVQSLYNAMFGIHLNGLCYKRIVLKKDNFIKEL